MCEIRRINEHLIVQYDLAYSSAANYAIQAFTGLSLTQLEDQRTRLSYPEGTLSIAERAWRRGQLDFLELLIQAEHDKAGEQAR